MKLNQPLEGWGGGEKPLRGVVTSTKCPRSMNDIMLDPPAQETSLDETNKTSQVAGPQYQGWAARDTHVLLIAVL